MNRKYRRNQLEDVWRSLIEAPTRKRDARVNCLKLPFEVEKVGSVPRQKARYSVGLRRAHVRMHTAEIRETTQALVVEPAKTATKRLRSPAVKVLSFLRTRTVT